MSRVALPGGARTTPRPRAGQPAGLPADGDEFDAEAFAQLYSKLAATLSASQTVAERGSTLLSVMVPGQYLEQNLDPADPATQYLLSNLLNPALECSWIVRRSPATVPDVYESILNGKETPLVSLSPEQKAKLDAANRLLFQPDGEPTPYFADYLTDAAAYATALAAYEEAVTTQNNGGPPVPQKVKAELKAADKRWREHGHMADADRALATISELEAFEPDAYWHRLAVRYRDATRRLKDSAFQEVNCIPPYPRWFDDEGWTQFEFNELDFANQDRSGGIGVGDCNRCCAERVPPSAYGGFHSAASGFAADGTRLPTAVPAQFRLTAKLRRVELLRPWLDPLVLHSRAWRWSPASASYGVVVCSGGTLAGSVVPTGVMPLLPVTALLARDVDIYWSDGGELAPAIERFRGLGHEIRFGPFLLTRAVRDAEIIHMPDPQLIGFLSQVLPRSPDPDPRLPWPRHS